MDRILKMKLRTKEDLGKLNLNGLCVGLTCPPKTDPVAMLGFGSKT